MAVSNDPNKAFDRFVNFVGWVREQDKVFTACQAACKTDISERSAYRYLSAMMKIDDRLIGEPGIGYLYRRRK